MTRPVRVRFAPSPTGPLHIGGVRTALYNYFFARRNGGQFILRIEDTDSQRYVEGAEQYIIESLRWCGITIDEGVEQGGPHAPYRQSERKELYRKYADDLVASGNAYFAFDTPEALEGLRAQYESRGEVFAYNYSIRGDLETSLNFGMEETLKRIERGDQWVVRFKMPENEEVNMKDLIRGDITVNTNTLDDKVLFKSADSLPTYHLANIVDDHLMEISHVIRGEEWLPSLPLHVLLYRALGWTETQPEFAHLPLLLKPTGKGKLSKRDGDKMGFPVFPLQWTDPVSGEVSRGYREDGYFPDAFINMLALLGWNPGTEQEIFDMTQLINEFSLEKVGKSGARFDPQKAEWFNAQYLHAKSDQEVTDLFDNILKEKNIDIAQDILLRIVSLTKQRVSFVKDLWNETHFFFEPPVSYEEKTAKKFWKGDNPQRLMEVSKLLDSTEPFDRDRTHDTIAAWISDNGLPMGQIMNTLRLALVGEAKGPDLFEIVSILGKDETNRRINNIIQHLPVGQ